MAASSPADYLPTNFLTEAEVERLILAKAEKLGCLSSLHNNGETSLNMFAKLVGVSYPTASRWRKEGWISAVRRGRRWFVPYGQAVRSLRFGVGRGIPTYAQTQALEEAAQKAGQRILDDEPNLEQAYALLMENRQS